MGFPRSRLALPPRLSGIAPLAFPHQEQAGGGSSLRRQLQPPPRRQRQRLFRFGNDQSHRRCAQALLKRPQQIGLALRGQKQQPLRHAWWQPLRQGMLRLISWQQPDHRPMMARGLKHRKGAPVPALRFMHTARCQQQRIGSQDPAPKSERRDVHPQSRNPPPPQAGKALGTKPVRDP